MLDTRTGALTLASSNLRFAPAMRVEDFFASPATSEAVVVVRNPPHETYGFTTQPGDLGEIPFWIDAQFYNGQLEALSLLFQAPEFGLPYEQWSEAGESARHTAHLAWLKSQGAHAAVYDWGEITASIAPQDAIATISIRYASEGKPWRGRNNSAHGSI